MLGFDISERTVARWIRKAPRNPEPAKQWAAFLSNHREAIAAKDFFTVPTLNRILTCCSVDREILEIRAFNAVLLPKPSVHGAVGRAHAWDGMATLARIQQIATVYMMEDTPAETENIPGSQTTVNN